MEHGNGWCFRGIYKGGLWEDDLHVSALPAIASGMDIVSLKVSVVVPKPFDTCTTSYHILGHLESSFEMDFNSSVCFYRTQMTRLMTKPTKWHVRPPKTQISLGIRPV